MADYVYYLEDPIGDVSPREKALLRFNKDTGELLVYRYKTHSWEDGYYYAKMFYGGIDVDQISKEKADQLIKTVYNSVE